MDKSQFQDWLNRFSTALGLSPTDSADLAGAWNDFNKRGVSVVEADAVLERIRSEGFTVNKARRIPQLLVVLTKVRKPPEVQNANVYCYICNSTGAVRVPAFSFARPNWPPTTMVMASCDCNPAPGCSFRLQDYEARYPGWPIELKKMQEQELMKVFASRGKRITAAAYEVKCKELAEAITCRKITMPEAKKQLAAWVRSQPGVDVPEEAEEVEF